VDSGEELEQHEEEPALVEAGSSLGNYHNLRCAERGGEWRASFYCKAFCASTSWSDQRRNKVRSQCPAWKAYNELVG